MTQLGSGFAAVRHRNFRLYWIGQIVSLVGTWMQTVSQPWLVLLLGGSPIQLGVVLALQFAPSLALAPLGGVLADRFDKRRLLLFTESFAALQAVALFVLTATGLIEIWQIMVLALAIGFVNALDMPVRQSFAAELVPRSDLVNAITLNSASFNLARVLGPAIAGITLALYGPAFNFAINAVSYLAVLGALLRMDPAAMQPVTRPDQRPSIRFSLAEGIRYAIRTPTVLWPLVLLGGMGAFGMNFQTLLPLFARFTLSLDADGFGALFAAMGLGSLIGSLSLAFLGSRRPLVGMILGGGLSFVSFEALLGLSRTTLAAFPLIVIVGFSAMLMINSINVVVQRSVPDQLRGRVMSLYVTVFAGSVPIGGPFAGIVAQTWGPPAGFLVGAAVGTMFIGLVGWQLVVLRKGRTDHPPPAAASS
ncbi:MAG: MFS transporter [Chloroflexota bacterium]|nr:MFS transporter [Chloroflexota bacterium]